MSVSEMKIEITQGSEFKGKEGFVLVHCEEDNKGVSVPEALVPKCTFIHSGDDSKLTFESSGEVLMNLVEWVDARGMKGEASSELPRPCPYRDFSFVFPKGAWETDYFEKLFTPTKRKYFLPTINIAEKYEMQGLVDLMSIGLGCKLRNFDEQQAVQEVFGVEVHDHEEEIEEEWIKELIKPTFIK